MREIYKLVHIPSWWIRRPDSTASSRADEVESNIQDLMNQGKNGSAEVGFVSDETTVDDLEHEPRDTKIIVGGGMKERCVATYVKALKKAGFTNIEVRDELTFSDINK
jgi:hypothetical protein